MLWMLFEQINIDFLTELSEYNGFGKNMIYIDHYSKMVVLVLFWEFDAWIAASCFLAEIVSYQELQATIISDIEPDCKVISENK